MRLVFVFPLLSHRPNEGFTLIRKPYDRNVLAASIQKARPGIFSAPDLRGRDLSL
jgi:hypothetical protein